MLNEQTIILSRETVMNLISYNGFFLTFFKMVISNIVIRQVIINVVAILMHNDYHNAKIQVAKEELDKKKAQKEALRAKVDARLKREERKFI